MIKKSRIDKFSVPLTIGVFLVIIILFLFENSLLSPFHFVSKLPYVSSFHPITPIQNTPTPTDTPTPYIGNSQTNNNQQWGQTTQLGPHTYTTKVSNDPIMATPQEIFQALNNYRQVHGVSALSWDNTLTNYAQQRAITCPQDGQNGTPHAGLDDFIKNHNGGEVLGFGALGENCAWGYTLSGVHLIEWIYAGDADHNSVQLSTLWQYVGIAVNGSNSELLFGGNKQ